MTMEGWRGGVSTSGRRAAARGISLEKRRRHMLTQKPAVDVCDSLTHEPLKPGNTPAILQSGSGYLTGPSMLESSQPRKKWTTDSASISIPGVRGQTQEAAPV